MIGQSLTLTGADVKPVSKYCCVANQVRVQSMRADDWRLDRLIDRLPNRVRTTVRFLRQPSARWLRFPMGLLLAAAEYWGSCRSLDSGCFLSAWRSSLKTSRRCGPAGHESWIGSSIGVQIGWLTGLAHNDFS